ncbi:MAG: 3-deoxy-D-manno-octulosonic acid transferase [Gemmataceae bacterium]
MTPLLDLAYLSALAAASPYLAYRSLRSGRYRRQPLARLFGPAALPATRQPRAWFHGVSVGEVHLLRQVLAGFRERRPDWECVVSASTDTGLDEAKRCFADLTVIPFPLDFSWAVRRALAAVNPRLLVLAEGELWPNMLRAAKARGVKTAVINGRFSPRSARRYQRFAALARPMLQRVDLYAMQTEEYADNLRQIGVPSTRVAVTGSVKYDGLAGDRAGPKTIELGRTFGIVPGDLVWVAGSTQAPEEQIVLDAFRRLRAKHANLKLILVPRQRDRFDEVAKLLDKCSVPYARRSRLKAAATTPVVLLDTMGELSAAWGLADVAYVGGSMDGVRGGQNMLEPASFGAAVTFGPHVWNFRDAAARLVAEGGAVQVADAAELERATAALLADPSRRKRMGAAARRLVLSQQGATAKTLDLLDFLIAPRVAKAG